jgi:uncharacterized protein (TIGR02271 family)
MADQITTSDAEQLVGQDAVDSSGEKVGSITDVYLDDATGAPEWVAVKTGLFGMRSSFVPISGASRTGDEVRLAHTKDQIKDAPNVDADGTLSQDEEQQLYRHYNMNYSEAPSPSGLPGGERGTTDRGTTGHDTSGPTTDNAMTRSEEELDVKKRSQEAGRARLRKHVVTEKVQESVPVTREEVRVEREPVTDGNVDQAMDGPAISEEEHEVVLHEEEVVADKRAVPKERVRLDTETVTEQQQVEADLRKEEIEVEGDTRGRNV